MHAAFVFTGLLFFLIITCSCSGKQDEDNSLYRYPVKTEIPLAYEGINELRKGDIIVKPNLNILPGTAFISEGWGFGHAAIVTRGAINSHPDSLLKQTIIFESHARDVPQFHQLREISGHVLHPDPAFCNTNFSPRYTGSRYRLRLNIEENQIDAIIDFVRSQKGSYSSWNAMKRFPGMPGIEKMVEDGIRDNWADNTHWYCSLLVWQAVMYITGIDLDANGGYYVYPSDLIASPYFDNTPEFKARVKF